jgi:hypothetical protein
MSQARDTDSMSGMDAIDSILNALPDPAVILDREGRLVRGNRLMGDLLGFEIDTLRGTELTSSLSGRPPCPAAGAPGLHRRETAIWQTWGRWFRLTASPIAGPDPEFAVLVTVQDVTELERLRAETCAVAAAAEARIEELEKEVRLAQALSNEEEAGEGSQVPESGIEPSLRARAPALYREFVADYESLLLRGLEGLIHGSEPLSQPLRAMSIRLGKAGAGPRDVIEIHGLALRHRSEGQPPGTARALADEGRLMVLQLMGYLVGYYRTRTRLSESLA